MNADKLVRMAEQVAINVTASRDVDTVAECTAAHLKRFWDPRMREQLIVHADRDAPTLSPAVRKAIDRLRKPGD